MSVGISNDSSSMDAMITLKLHMLSVGKAQQLLQGIQSVGDEGAQLTAVIEMCQVSSYITVTPVVL